MDELGPGQQMAVRAFLQGGGGGGADGGVSSGAMERIRQLAVGARKRVDERYFNGTSHRQSSISMFMFMFTSSSSSSSCTFFGLCK